MPIISYPNRNAYGQYETTTHISVPDPDLDHGNAYRVNVRVTMERGFYSWSCPDADTLRKQVDKALAGTTFRRVGRRDYRPDGPLTEWWYVYYVKRVTA